jgi:hypothetical protein
MSTAMHYRLLADGAELYSGIGEHVPDVGDMIEHAGKLYQVGGRAWKSARPASDTMVTRWIHSVDLMLSALDVRETGE